MKTKNSKRPAKIRRPSAAPSTPPKIKKILATTDFSDASRHGVGYAVALAEKLGAAVALLHVVEPGSWVSNMGSVIWVREDSEVVASAREKLATMAEREGKGEVAVTFSVALRTGNAFDAIATAALEHGSELIVIATHGRTWADRVLLGSTAERVVRHAPCPVLTVPARSKSKRTRKTAEFRLRKILVPIDFSGVSKAALPWATLLAARCGAEVVLLHAVERPPVDDLWAPGLNADSFAPLMKQAGADLERIAGGLSKSTGSKISAAVREGSPYEAICEAAKTLDADLIVLTTHGYTGLKKVWLGSTAERVVRHSPCPVLTVRELQRKPR